ELSEKVLPDQTLYGLRMVSGDLNSAVYLFVAASHCLRAGAGGRKAKKRTIAETSNVITETLPSIQEPETLEIEQDGAVFAAQIVEIEAAPSVGDAGEGRPGSVGSALALLADITSKYQQDERERELEKDGEAGAAVREVGAEAGVHVVEVLAQGDKLFCCEKCSRSFRLYYHFKEHLKVHSGEIYACHLCNKRYTRESAWKQHLAWHQEEEAGSKKPRCMRKVHVCQYCQKQFDHFGHFKEHLRKHTGEKPFECPNCHERFARNSTLKCHLVACRTGVGAKKGRKKLYECQVCCSVFPSWDQFKSHLAVHTGAKPNHCTLCDMWFMRPGELRQHLREVHGLAQLEPEAEPEPEPEPEPETDPELSHIVVPMELIEAEAVAGETVIEQVTV
uniref:Zinc finger protein 131 n=1 Tax=Callorhinchus milii TaxID=7868 RepID=A0A4W3GQ24_CALMI